ncbi:MAG: helix-turn-helix domain-containing protein [Myxococcota bacterium]
MDRVASAVAAVGRGDPTAGQALLAVYAHGPRAVLDALDGRRPFDGVLTDWARWLCLDGPAPRSPDRPDGPTRLVWAAADGSTGGTALATLGDALALAVDDPDATLVLRWRLAEALLQVGRHSDGEAAADALPDTGFGGVLRAKVRATLAIERGLPELADALLAIAADQADRAAALFEGIGFRRWENHALVYLAQARLILGRPEAALAAAERIDGAGTLGASRALLRAEAAAALGRVAEARSAAVAALTAFGPEDPWRWRALAVGLAATRLLGIAHDPTDPTDSTDSTDPIVRETAALGALTGDQVPTAMLAAFVARRWALDQGPGPEALVARARATGDHELVAAASGLAADDAWDAGGVEAALAALDDAAEACRDLPARAARTARQRARILAHHGDPTEARRVLVGLVDQAERRRDLLGELLARAALAEAWATDDPDEARRQAARAAGIADLRGLQLDGVAWLARALGTAPSTTPRPPRTARDQVLAAAAALWDPAAGSGAIDALERALCALPPATRGPWARLCRSALAAAGLDRRVDAGPRWILFRASTLELVVGDAVVGFGRARQRFELLRALAVGDGRDDRASLYEAVWGLPYRPPSSDNALNVAVTRLRRTLAPVGLDLATTPAGGRVVVPACSVYLSSR